MLSEWVGAYVGIRSQQGSGRDGHPSKPIHPRYVLPQAEGRKARNQKLCCA